MDARQHAPSTARNRAAILAVLHRVLPADARVLELAAGAGEHAVYFAQAMPGVTWQPSDPDADARASIAAWIEAESAANVRPPIAIDVIASDWGVEAERYDALIAINMIHISPWEATLGLIAGARRLLTARGQLITYGPYKRGGRHTAPSNESFEDWLRARDPRFGVRDIADVETAAKAQGLMLRETVPMPANNFMLVFAR
jgi:cyclopropane fatty-acyl-phospholipid synthase-like methyltransferase